MGRPLRRRLSCKRRSGGAGIRRQEISPDFQQNCKLLLFPLRLPLRNLQSVNSLLKNCRLLEQFVMEFIELSNCLGFHNDGNLVLHDEASTGFGLCQLRFIYCDSAFP